MRSLNIGATGMLAQQTNVDVISNNIANMNTTAYSKRRAEFNDLLYQNIVRPGAVSTAGQTIVPAGIQLGTGVKVAAIDALKYIQRPEYKEEMTTLFTLAGTDINPDVAYSAQRALMEINNSQ